METVKCPSCNNYSDASKPYCEYCGTQIASELETTLPLTEVKARNGFTSFWLWLSLVLNGLMLIGYVALLFSSIGLWQRTPEPMPLRLYWVASTAALVYAFYLLLRYRRLGFTICAIVACISVVVNLALGQIIGSLSPLIPLAILYGILHLKKNGNTCWSLLD